MDYRRPLFQLEQWSPFLAKKIWGLTSLLDAPFNLALGFKVLTINDLNLEALIPSGRLTRDEKGYLSSAAILAAGEFVAKILWHRHLVPRNEEMILSSIHCRFIKRTRSAVRARVELAETERENILRKLRSGKIVDVEMAVIFIDERDHQIANLNCVWQIKGESTLALAQGQRKESENT